MIRTRILATLIVASTAPMALGDELDVKIDFTSKAKSSKSIVEELGALAKVNLSTTPATADENLVIVAKKRTLRELMDKIAEATDADWLKEANGYRLVRSAKRVDEQRAKLFASDLEVVSKRLTEMRLASEKFGSYTADKARAEFEKEKKNRELIESQRMQGGASPIRFESPTTPSLWALQRGLSGLDPKTLAQLPRRTRTVFALTPNAMQRPMPASMANVLSNYASIHNLYARQSAATPENPAGEVIIIGDQQSGRAFDSIGEAFFVVVRDASGSYYLTLIVGDSKGAKVASASSYISFSGSSAPNEPVEAKSGEDGQRIMLGEESKKHASLLQYSPPAANGDVMMFRSSGGARSVAAVTIRDGSPPASSSAKPTIDARWRQVLLHPELHEPNGFAASEFLIQCAEKSDSNLVANLDDNAALRYSLRANDALRPSDVLGVAKNGLDSEVKSDGGWIVVKPRLFYLARERRLDRRALAVLAQNVAKEGRLSLEGTASFAQKMVGPYAFGGFADRYLGLINGPARSLFTDGLTRQFDLMRLLGSLDPSRARMLMEGGKLQMNVLSNDQRASAHKIVFDSMAGPEIDRPTPAGQPRLMTQSVSRFTEGAMFSEGPMFSFGSEIEFLGDERTEFLSSGLPFDGFIQVETESEEAVYATSPTLDEGRFFSAPEYAMMQSLSTNANLVGGGQVTQYDKFKMGRRVSYMIHFQLTTTARTTHMVRDAIVDPNLQSVAYEQLPESFRKEVESSRGNMRFGERPPPTSKRT